jgi:ApeA N-terminal domain 1
VRSFNDSFETVGEWFLPDNPNRRIAGTLSYTPAGAEIHLNEAIRPLEGAIYAVTGEPYPILYGSTRDGDAMTVIEAHHMGVSINFGSGGIRQPERLYSTELIIGAHVPVGFAYPEIRFRVPGLEVWLSRQLIEESLQKNESTGRFLNRTYRLKFPPEETSRVDIVDANLKWLVEYQSQSGPFSISVTTAGWISVQPDSPQPFEWYLDQLTKIATLLTFLAGGSMLADAILASIDNSRRRASILLPRPPTKHWTPSNLSNFFISRGGMGGGFNKIIATWFEEYPKIHQPSQLALNVMLSDNLWHHVEFLSLIQALEGFHRALYPGEYMSRSDYREIERALREAVPANATSDHRQALHARIRYGYQFSLAKRLGELASRLTPQVRALIFGPDERVPRKWVDTRNYYTHWDEDLRPNTLGHQEMIYAHVRMRHFLRALYLDLAGVPQETILTALNNTSLESQYLIQLNAAEIRRDDPHSTAGLMAVIERRAASDIAESEESSSRQQP